MLRTEETSNRLPDPSNHLTRRTASPGARFGARSLLCSLP